MARVELKGTPVGVIVSRSGRPRAGVTFTITGGTLYTASTGTTVQSDLITNEDGECPGWLEPGLYTITDTTTNESVTFEVGGFAGVSDLDMRLDALESGRAATRVYYVRTDGSDANTGLSAEKAVATLPKAIALAKAAGGGHIRMGAGVWAMPTGGANGAGNNRLYVNCSNLTIEGIPGATIIRAMNLEDGSFYIGWDAPGETFTAGGGVYEQIHLYGLVIDQSAANQSNAGNANTVIFSQVQDCSMRKCVLMGGNYMLTYGGGTKPATRVVAEDNLLIANYTSAAPVCFAPVNSKDCEFVENKIYAPGSQTQEILLMDAEPNELYNHNSGLLFARNKAERMGAIITQPGGATDERRLGGVQILDNELVNCGAMGIGTPYSVVARNVMRRDRKAPAWAQQRAISLVHVNDNTVLSPHHCLVEDNVLIDHGGATNLAPVILIDSAHNTVRGNKILESRRFMARAIWGIEERQIGACLVSGGAPGVPSGMTFSISALEVQAANAGAAVSRAAQTVTIAAADTYERLDAVFVDVATGNHTVYRSVAPPAGVDPAPPNAPTTSVPICTVRVPANAAALSRDDIFDRRYFRPDHNDIAQDEPSVPLRRGTVKLRTGSMSTRRPRRIERVTSAYSLSVLEDKPVAYWPLQETTAPLMRDISGRENDGAYDGGVLLNQTIGTRKGALFNGVDGYAQAEIRPEARFRGSFTIEMQAKPDNLTVHTRLIGSGYTATNNPNFHIYVAPSGLLTLVTGDKFADSVTALGTASLTHIAVVVTATAVTFYFNGTADATVAITAPVYTTAYEDWPVMIGASDTTGTGEPAGFFPGYIRHVALFDKALNGTRIAAHAGLM